MLAPFPKPCTHVDELVAAATVQLRNPRTIGTCLNCGGEARLTPGGWRCSQNLAQPATPRRPAGYGTGLDGPVCPEHRDRPQTPDGLRIRMCVRCGRITARLDADDVGWCGGDLPLRSDGTPVRHLQAVA